MNCEEFRAGYLAGDKSKDFGRHLDGCGSCRSMLGGLEAWSETLSEPLLWEEPSPRVGDQVESLLNSAAASRPGRPSGAWRWWSLGAAAMLLIVVGVMAFLSADSPDWEVELVGRGPTPEASATVAGWSNASGTRLRLDIEGLAEAPPGYVYEFWLSEGGRHISAGTFSGTRDVELWSGVQRRDFPRLWVTLEPLDDDAAPSSQTVLDTEGFDTEGYSEPARS